MASLTLRLLPPLPTASICIFVCGQTTFARAVFEELGGSKNVAYLAHDCYYKDISHKSLEERDKVNFDHPESLDTDLLVEHIKQLKSGHSVNVPVYDFSVHGRTDKVTVIESKPIILVEGILVFAYPPLMELFDTKVYVEATSDIRLMRRITRDINERSRSVVDVMRQYEATVRPMHFEFVEPCKSLADVIVHTNGVADRTSVSLQMVIRHLRCAAGLDT